MSFVRTKSGLNNYSFFFDCELIVYTEGTINENTINYDKEYYHALLSDITKKQRIKIKPIGNKSDALEYLNIIEENNLKNSIVFIDKDLINITSSTIENKKLFITNGYSWENDFWSKKLCQEVLNMIAYDNNKTNIDKAYSFVERRVARICAFDAAYQVDGKCLIKKNGSSCGVNSSAKEPFFISHNEIRRHAEKFKNSQFDRNGSITKQVYDLALQQDPCKIIQGHLWEFLSVTIISRYYKKITNNKSTPCDLIKNIAFSIFCKSPTTYISDEFHLYLKNQFISLEQ